MSGGAGEESGDGGARPGLGLGLPAATDAATADAQSPHPHPPFSYTQWKKASGVKSGERETGQQPAPAPRPPAPSPADPSKRRSKVLPTTFDGSSIPAQSSAAPALRHTKSAEQLLAAAAAKPRPPSLVLLGIPEKDLVSIQYGSSEIPVEVLSLGVVTARSNLEEEPLTAIPPRVDSAAASSSTTATSSGSTSTSSSVHASSLLPPPAGKPTSLPRPPMAPSKLRHMQLADCDLYAVEPSSFAAGSSSSSAVGSSSSSPTIGATSSMTMTMTTTTTPPGHAIRPPTALPTPRPGTPLNSASSTPTLFGTPDSSRTATDSTTTTTATVGLGISFPGPVSRKPKSFPPPTAAQPPVVFYSDPIAAKRARRKWRLWKLYNYLRVLFSLLLASSVTFGISFRIFRMKSSLEVENLGFSTVTDCSILPAGYSSPPPSVLSPLEPAAENAPIFGFQMDWAIDTPINISKRIGRRPGIYGAWLSIDDKGWDRAMLDWYPKMLLHQAEVEGGEPSLLMVTLLPNTTMDLLPAGWPAEFAAQLAEINLRGVGIILRFAHEMNGQWHPYGQLPLSYTSTFRLLSTEIRKRTRMTALMWAPNAGNCGYPWVGSFGGNYYPVQKGNGEQEALDTNGDGRIDWTDDPYVTPSLSLRFGWR